MDLDHEAVYCRWLTFRVIPALVMCGHYVVPRDSRNICGGDDLACSVAVRSNNPRACHGDIRVVVMVFAPVSLDLVRNGLRLLGGRTHIAPENRHDGKGWEVLNKHSRLRYPSSAASHPLAKCVGNR